MAAKNRYPTQEILQTLEGLQDQLRSAYGDRWTLLIETPDFAVLPTVAGAPRWRPAAGSREEKTMRQPPAGGIRAARKWRGRS